MTPFSLTMMVAAVGAAILAVIAGEYDHLGTVAIVIILVGLDARLVEIKRILKRPRITLRNDEGDRL